MDGMNVTMTALRAFLGLRVARLRTAAAGRDRGASAVELAIITAVILGIAVALLLVIGNFVKGESSKINSNGG
jgi:Flp pilus assembly protein TadG